MHSKQTNIMRVQYLHVFASVSWQIPKILATSSFSIALYLVEGMRDMCYSRHTFFCQFLYSLNRTFITFIFHF